VSDARVGVALAALNAALAHIPVAGIPAGQKVPVRVAPILEELAAAAKSDRDAEWYERARRYFVAVRDPRVHLKDWAPGSTPADFVMHEVWKRDPAVTDLVEALEALANAFDLAIVNGQVDGGTENSRIAQRARDLIAEARQ
jgi:hypothetical protein